MASAARQAAVAATYKGSDSNPKPVFNTHIVTHADGSVEVNVTARLPAGYAITAVLNHQQSYVVVGPPVDYRSTYLLNHESLHFTLFQLVAARATTRAQALARTASNSACGPLTAQQKQQLIDNTRTAALNDLSQQFQDLKQQTDSISTALNGQYDTETANSQNVCTQAEWDANYNSKANDVFSNNGW